MFRIRFRNLSCRFKYVCCKRALICFRKVIQEFYIFEIIRLVRNDRLWWYIRWPTKINVNLLITAAIKTLFTGLLGFFSLVYVWIRRLQCSENTSKVQLLLPSSFWKWISCAATDVSGISLIILTLFKSISKASIMQINIEFADQNSILNQFEMVIWNRRVLKYKCLRLKKIETENC